MDDKTDCSKVNIEGSNRPSEDVTAPNDELQLSEIPEREPSYTTQDRMDVYNQICQRLEEGKLKNSELFDQAVLTLSSGALVLSMAFVKDIVPISRLIWTPALFLSWIFFAGTILSTLLSFISSQKAHEVQREYLDAYFIRNEEDACDRPNKYSTITVRLNQISTGCFFLAVVVTIAFSWKNISREQEFSRQTSNPTVIEQGKEAAPLKDEKVTTPESTGKETGKFIPENTEKLVPAEGEGLGAKPSQIPNMPPQTKDSGKK